MQAIPHPLSVAARLVQAAHANSLFVVVPQPLLAGQPKPTHPDPWWQQAHSLMAGRRAPGAPTAFKSGELELQLLDQVAPDAAMLVNMTDEQRLAALQHRPDLRIEPAALVAPLWLRRVRTLAKAPGAPDQGNHALRLKVLDATTRAPIAGAHVYAYSRYSANEGVSARTNAKGVATLRVSANVARFEVIEVQPEHSHWPMLLRSVPLADGKRDVACPPIRHRGANVLRHFKMEGADADGQGVRVAVIDTGADLQHPDLRITKGACTIAGEDPADANDVQGHGTHVVGIIAGRATPGRGVRGLAPAADIHAYRVFGRGTDLGVALHIAKAVRAAVDDGCDLINLSLGGSQDMPEVWREIQRARRMGVVCLAATGNDNRAPVLYPARYSPVLAVSAFGRRGTYPRDSAQELSQAKPHGKPDGRNYVAAFANVGTEVKLTGPGVGVVSCYPGGRYAVMDGTSMACPAITGALARRLGQNPTLLHAPRNEARWTAITTLAAQAAQSLGFGLQFEGSGLLV